MLPRRRFGCCRAPAVRASVKRWTKLAEAYLRAHKHPKKKDRAGRQAMVRIALRCQ